MKVILTGPVLCKVCNWNGLPEQLKEECNGELIKCPKCDGIVMDIRGGNFIIQNIEAGKLTVK